MIRCEDMLDRMPVVAAAGGNWTEAEEQHLRDCVECAKEWKIIAAGRRLGAGADAGINADAIAVAVLRRLAQGRRRRGLIRRVGWVVGLAAAASLTFVVLTGRRGPEPPDRHGLVIPVAELDSLDAVQLQAVYESLEAPLVEGAGSENTPLGELDEQQLERILRSLEG